MQKSVQFPVSARRAICTARRAVVRDARIFDFLNGRDAPTQAARRATSRRLPCHYSMAGATRHIPLRGAQ
ncbi:hypothetical protein A2U01_0051710, partial [Trifolium medium]|nr:hypothetical protein [Trifolium medium]